MLKKLKIIEMIEMPQGLKPPFFPFALLRGLKALTYLNKLFNHFYRIARFRSEACLRAEVRVRHRWH